MHWASQERWREEGGIDGRVRRGGEEKRGEERRGEERWSREQGWGVREREGGVRERRSSEFFMLPLSCFCRRRRSYLGGRTSAMTWPRIATT